MPEQQYEYEEEQQPRNIGRAYDRPQDFYGSQISILTNPKDSLYQFELFLRCLKQNEDGNLVKIGGKYWKPLMNDIGINSVLMSMHSIVNNMTPLSNLEDWEVAILIRHLGWNLVDDLAFNRAKFGITEVNRRIVTGAALRYCYVFLKRPYQEGDRKFFKGITHEIKQTTETPRAKGGFSLNPFKWGK